MRVLRYEKGQQKGLRELYEFGERVIIVSSEKPIEPIQDLDELLYKMRSKVEGTGFDYSQSLEKAVNAARVANCIVRAGECAKWLSENSNTAAKYSFDASNYIFVSGNMAKYVDIIIADRGKSGIQVDYVLAEICEKLGGAYNFIDVPGWDNERKDAAITRHNSTIEKLRASHDKVYAFSNFMKLE